jgi:hypothetical protein
MLELNLDDSEELLRIAMSSSLVNKTNGLLYGNNKIIASETIRNNGVLRRAVELYPNEAFSGGYDISLNVENKSIDLDEIKNYLEAVPVYVNWMKSPLKYSIFSAFKHCSKLARMYGGSFLILGLRDNQEMDQPMKTTSMKGLDWVKIYDPYEVEIYEKEDGITYLRTLYNTNSESIFIHPDRYISFAEFECLSDVEFANTRRLGNSVLQLLDMSFENWKDCYNDVYHLLKSSNFWTLGIKELKQSLEQDLLNGTKNTEKYITNRSAAIKSGIDIYSLLNYDMDNEVLMNVNRSLQGIKDSVEALTDVFCSNVDIPRDRLLNSLTTGGLATTVNAARILDFNWCCMLQKWTYNNWKDPLDRVLSVVFNIFYGKIPDGYTKKSITFPFQYVTTAEEQAGLQSTYADIAVKLIGQNVLSADEVREQYRHEQFNPNINVKGSSPDPVVIEDTIAKKDIPPASK